LHKENYTERKSLNWRLLRRVPAQHLFPRPILW
jgi:hypothetical protein